MAWMFRAHSTIRLDISLRISKGMPVVQPPTMRRSRAQWPCASAFNLASPATLAALCVANALFDTRKRRTSRAAKSTNVFIQTPIAPGCQRRPHAQWGAELSACRACNVRTRTSAGTARDRASYSSPDRP